MTRHTCHAEGCRKTVSERMHMCKSHWWMVPKPLRDALWDAYVHGQEIRKDPSSEYLVAAERCIGAVAVKEGRISQVEATNRLLALRETLGV